MFYLTERSGNGYRTPAQPTTKPRTTTRTTTHAIAYASRPSAPAPTRRANPTSIEGSVVLLTEKNPPHRLGRGVCSACRGTHNPNVGVICGGCGHHFHIGIDIVVKTDPVACPRCDVACPTCMMDDILDTDKER